MDQKKLEKANALSHEMKEIEMFIAGCEAKACQPPQLKISITLFGVSDFIKEECRTVSIQDEAMKALFIKVLKSRKKQLEDEFEKL